MPDLELLLLTTGAALGLALVVLGPPLVAVVISERENKRIARRYQEEREQAHRDHLMRAALFHGGSETSGKQPVAQSQPASHNPGRRRLLPLND